MRKNSTKTSKETLLSHSKMNCMDMTSIFSHLKYSLSNQFLSFCVKYTLQTNVQSSKFKEIFRSSFIDHEEWDFTLFAKQPSAQFSIPHFQCDDI